MSGNVAVVRRARGGGEETRAARARATAGSGRTRTRTRPAERRDEPPVFTAVRRGAVQALFSRVTSTCSRESSHKSDCTPKVGI